MTISCNHCDGESRLFVRLTLPKDNEIWRSRVCSECGGTTPTIERAVDAWPGGFWAGEKARRKGAAARERDKVVDAFAPDAGADLAGIMAAFTRPRVTA